MTIDGALRGGVQALRRVGTDWEAAWLETELLLAHVVQQERTWLVAHGGDSLSPSKERVFSRLIERRTRHEPVAYLLGKKDFCGLSFEVNRHVLIPRPETEKMVDLVREADGSTLVWDVGTGCGAIAVSVRRFLPHATIVASDVSRHALSVAEKNAERLLAKDQTVYFFQGSLLTRAIQYFIITHRPTRLIILANLPYLPLSDRQVLEKDVVDFEPSKALFTGEEGNALIIKLMKQLARFFVHDRIDMRMMFEFDPPQTGALRSVARNMFPDAKIEVHRDHCGRERFLLIDTT